MNWTKLYRRIPDRVRIGVAGIVVAAVAINGPALLYWWLCFWS